MMMDLTSRPLFGAHLELWVGQPCDEHQPEDTVQRHPVEDDIEGPLDQLQGADHHPVCQPLLVVSIIGGLDGQEGIVGGVYHANDEAASGQRGKREVASNYGKGWSTNSHRGGSGCEGGTPLVGNRLIRNRMTNPIQLDLTHVARAMIFPGVGKSFTRSQKTIPACVGRGSKGPLAAELVISRKPEANSADVMQGSIVLVGR